MHRISKLQPGPCPNTKFSQRCPSLLTEVNETGTRCASRLIYPVVLVVNRKAVAKLPFSLSTCEKPEPTIHGSPAWCSTHNIPPVP
eukprot:1412062-Rhodomonas_salina.1